jgi:hypothetical protein
VWGLTGSKLGAEKVIPTVGLNKKKSKQESEPIPFVRKSSL